jgi:hypothetical protein
VAVWHVVPLDQEHVFVAVPFPQNVKFRASQSGATHVQVPSAHNAASAVVAGSSAVVGLESGTPPPQATSSSPDSMARRVEFFLLYGFTVFSLERVGAGAR